ncbi:MAG: murein biosynthesis integral membrane protein MurJ [bacterium]|nr:murein biosynthesis integral membrane protein MurJ [bacterium]
MSLKSFSLSKVSRASAMLAFFYLLSRVVGLWRDRVLASRFGATDVLDAYYVSFNLPDLVFNLLVAGAISSAFIPVFTEYQAKKKGEEWELTNNFLNSLLLVGAVICFVLAIFAPVVIGIVAPGFIGPKKDLAILFTRVMMVSPIIFSVSMVLGSLLNIFERFLTYAMAPIMYNLGIIIGAVWLEPKFGPLGLAEGVVLGALLHFLIQLPSIWKIGFRWQGVLHWGDKGLRKVVQLALPRTFGLVAGQVNWIMLNALATTLGLGAVTIFNFANNLQYLPVALVGISVAIASFPALSREALQEDKREFVKHVQMHLRQVVFWALPLSVLIFFLREEAARIVLRSGNFSTFDASSTARVLGFFMIGAVSQSLIPILSRSFYAMQNTKTPVLISLISIAINAGLAIYFVKELSWGLTGLALAFSIAGIVNAILLLIYLKKFLTAFSVKSFFWHFGKVVAATLGMGAVLYYLSCWNWGGGHGLAADFYRAVIFSALALLTFLGLSAILRISFSLKK